MESELERLHCFGRVIQEHSLLSSPRYACNVNIFTLHNFCSTLIKQLVDLEKVRIDNLKFRTDLLDQVMDGWSVTQ